MKEIYIVVDSYIPNIAFTNRYLALARGYGLCGVLVTIIYIRPNRTNQKVFLEYDNVRYLYLYDHIGINNNYINLIWTMSKLFFMFNKNIPVIFYGMTDWLFLYRLRQHVKIYHERTEHPDICGKKSGIMGNIINKIYLRTCRNLDGLFVISPSLYDYFTKEVNVSKKKVHIINMLVDSKRFDNIENNPNSLYISYCGTISEYKDGVDILIEAFEKVHKIYPKYKLKLIGGFQNDSVKNNLLKIVDDLGLYNSVEFVGKVDANQMPLELANSKLLVLSRPNNKQAQYGFPTKLGEYLMTKVPVLVTNVGDIHCYLKDNDSIFFAQPDSVDDFAEKIINILDNYENALAVANRGKQVALKEFNYFIESKKVLDTIFN